MALLFGLFLILGCSATPEAEPTGVASPIEPSIVETDRATPTAVPPTPADSAPSEVGAPTLGTPASDRIVVATAGGEIYLIDPDGGQRLDLVDGESLGSQPVWSPDGRRIAWSQQIRSGFSIASANPDGSERRQAQTLFSGYFGYWNPTSTLLGFLGNAPPGTGLVLDAGSGADLDAVVDSDTFYYFSWNPDGTKWVVHSGSGLSIVSQDGSSEMLHLDDARFRAPTWAPDGQLLLAIAQEGRTVIVRVDPESNAVEELIEVGDVTNFVLDPTGRFLAIESLEVGATSLDDDESITVSAGQNSDRSEVLVYDLQTGETSQVLDEPSGGFWWSPDGTTLAVLAFEDTAAPRFTQWLIWRSDGSFRTQPFVVTPTFAATYVPFFDQFAQSVSPWAPDSTRFVYTGLDTQGEPGVFVQTAQSGTAPERIAADGAVAFWSPT
jgi:Tol biopolymer transport system component